MFSALTTTITVSICPIRTAPREGKIVGNTWSYYSKSLKDHGVLEGIKRRIKEINSCLEASKVLDNGGMLICGELISLVFILKAYKLRTPPQKRIASSIIPLVIV